MEWVLVLIGIGYSIWSSYRKEAKAKEDKLRSGGQFTPKKTADALFSQQGSKRRTLSRPSQDPNVVPELSVADLQEDFQTKLNRTLMERGAQPELRKTLSEIFGDAGDRFSESQTKPETERIKDYDNLRSYDQRTSSYEQRGPSYDQSITSYDSRASKSEHDPRSHFKLNEGLRKDSFKVGATNAFDDLDIEDAAELAKRPEARTAIKIDRASLKSYVVMHEVLGKPRALQASGGNARRKR